MDTIDATWIQGSFYPHKLATLDVEEVTGDLYVYGKARETDDR